MRAILTYHSIDSSGSPISVSEESFHAHVRFLGSGRVAVVPLADLPGLPDEKDAVALTFDDGPNDVHTPALLEVLARHNVRATFFMIGKFVEQRPAIARAVADAGHVIGNHTHTHPNLIFRHQSVVRRELEDCKRAFNGAGIAPAGLFRPPHGGRTPAVLRTVRDMSFEPIMWSVSGWDWNPHSPQKIAHIVHRQGRGGDVILLHDGSHHGIGTDRSASVRATELILERYLGEGYEFVTIPEMMKQN
jgi:peptidoglycan/xylan/chitin deacetylase (PgdA/CDA1 family)